MRDTSDTSLIVDELLSWSVSLSGIGPYALGRILRRFAQKLGARSLAYNLGRRPDATGKPTSYSIYASRKSSGRQSIRERQLELDDEWITSVLVGGNPVSLEALVLQGEARDSDSAKNFAQGVKEMGYRDGFLIPVYGPHRINGVIAFGFDKKLGPGSLELLEGVANIVPSIHCELVRLFYSPEDQPNRLSVREREVLTWIARGKSAAEVAMILRISGATVDTYTRRLFKKLGVNDRVSAALIGVESGLVSV